MHMRAACSKAFQSTTVTQSTFSTPPLHCHGLEVEVPRTDGGPLPPSARWPEVTADVAVGVSLAMTVLFLAVFVGVATWMLRTGYRLKP